MERGSQNIIELDRLNLTLTSNWHFSKDGPFRYISDLGEDLYKSAKAQLQNKASLGIILRNRRFSSCICTKKHMVLHMHILRRQINYRSHMQKQEACFRLLYTWWPISINLLAAQTLSRSIYLNLLAIDL